MHGKDRSTLRGETFADDVDGAVEAFRLQVGGAVKQNARHVQHVAVDVAEGRTGDGQQRVHRHVQLQKYASALKFDAMHARRLQETRYLGAFLRVTSKCLAVHLNSVVFLPREGKVPGRFCCLSCSPCNINAQRNAH